MYENVGHFDCTHVNILGKNRTIHIFSSRFRIGCAIGLNLLLLEWRLKTIIIVPYLCTLNTFNITISLNVYHDAPLAVPLAENKSSNWKGVELESVWCG